MIRFRRDGLPLVPFDIENEVELWARESGRHASVRFVPTRFLHQRIVAGTWTVRITLKDGDKRLLLAQEQRAPEEPVEEVWLHEPDGHGGYQPYDIEALGVGGVRQFLEKGNMWSGRGEFQSLTEQFEKTTAANEAVRQKVRDTVRDNARARFRDKRRQWFRIPLVRVLTDLVSRRPTTKETKS